MSPWGCGMLEAAPLCIFLLQHHCTKSVNPCSNMGGGDNIGGKYTSRLRDVLRFAPRLARGVRGMLPREFFFKWCNLVRFGVYLGQILSLKNFKNYYFLYTNLINYHFFNKNFKSYYFLYKK